MGCSSVMLVAQALQYALKSYVNAINEIISFNEPTLAPRVIIN